MDNMNNDKIKHVRFSVNKNVKLGMTKEDESKFLDKYEPAVIKWNEDDLKETLSNSAIDMSIFSNGYRKNENVKFTTGLMCDFDDGQPVDSIKGKVDALGSDYLVFSSVNYSDDHPKLRAWIPFNRHIEKEKDWETVCDYFRKQFPDTDPKSFTRSQYWFPSPCKVFHLVKDRDFFDVTKILESKTAYNLRDTDTKEPWPIGDWTFTLDDKVELANGGMETIRNIKADKTTIFCPVCGRKPGRNNPGVHNAFIVKNKFGNYDIYCTSKNIHYKQKEVTDDDFYYFQEKIRGDYYVYDDDGLRPMEKDKLKGMTERVTNQRWCNPPIHKIAYIPEGNPGLDREVNIFNCWHPSPVLIQAKKYVEEGAALETVSNKAKLFTVLKRHMFPEKERHDYTMDFLAATLKGYKLNTGIVLKDDGGTGKTLLIDVMFKEILQSNYAKFSSAMLKDKFNTWMKNKQFLFGDEIAHDKNTHESIADFLKGFITGDVSIRGMYKEWEFPEENKANMIVSSNRDAPIYIDDVDRRWNVFKPGQRNIVNVPGSQSWHLVNNPEWIELGVKNNIEGRERALDESVWMAVYLLLRKPDLDRLSTILDTPERLEVVNSLRTVFQDFAINLKMRNVDWIEENLPKIQGYGGDGQGLLCWTELRNVLLDKERNRVIKDHVYEVFKFMFPDYRNINKRSLTDQLKKTGLEDQKSNGQFYWTID